MLGASRRDQDDIDQQSFRQEEEADAKQLQSAARKALGKQPPPSKKKASVRAAQANERREEMNNVIQRTRSDDAEPTVLSEMPAAANDGTGTQKPPQPRLSSTSPLIELRKARLSRFNSERKFS